MRRRPVSPFSLSFLDIMFCGFGAVVLLVLILNHDTVASRDAKFADLRAEALRLEQEVIVGKQHLVQARNSVEKTDREIVETQGESARVIETSRELEIEIARLERETLAAKEHVNRLSSDLRNLEEEQKRLGATAPAERDAGERVHRFVGQGDRQYLTGLKMGGKNILVLVDASASMLDETIVNVVRRRNMSTAQKRSAPKWTRTVAAAEWIISNFPQNARFQLYTFNTTAVPASASGTAKWLSASVPSDVGGTVSALRRTVPGDGTSLHRAFEVIRKLAPKPDNVILVTDGLPTQGRTPPKRATVSGKERLSHFQSAVKTLPAGIPVNTILLPMEGDALAAAAFWKLALDTRGSFLTPARDWP